MTTPYIFGELRPRNQDKRLSFSDVIVVSLKTEFTWSQLLLTGGLTLSHSNWNGIVRAILSWCP